MSQENENRDEVNDTQENLEDSEEQSKEQGDEEKVEDGDEDVDWKERALKAESLIVKKKKQNKNDDEPKKESKPDGDYLTREEAVLLKDMDVEDLDKLKAVQKGEGHSSLKEAKESDLFTAYLERKEADRKKKEAQLGASKGSGGGNKKFRQGMSDEEHKKAWRERKSS